MTVQSLLVVGGDSTIGRQIALDCDDFVWSSTRRVERVGGKRFFLDLTKAGLAACLPDGNSPVLILAAKTGYNACESDPESVRINVDAPVSLARVLLAQGRRVVYVSTSSVFGGDLPFCGEDDVLAPQAAYSRQKAEAERQLNALPGWGKLGAIVRLTKVLAPDTSPIASWREAIARGGRISPFSDMMFAPISLRYAARNLCRIALSRCCGNFHLSGAADVSYVDFARRYVAAHDGDAALIVPTTSTQAGVDLLFNRRYSALGMSRTQETVGISPQDLDEVISDLRVAERSAE